MRKGLLVGLAGISNRSNASIKLGPVYHGILSLFLTRLSPVQPETGIKLIFSTLKPTIRSILETSFFISSYLSLFQLTEMSSILLTATISWRIPKVKAKNACSRVCPPGPMPASNSPFLAEQKSTAASAWLAPVIMFLTKSLWPGASITVMLYFLVWNCRNRRSMVTPLSRSSLRLSRTQAYLNVPLPIFSASSSKALIVRSSMAPAKYSRCPVVVDFPWSTCPMMMRFKWGFSLLLIFHSFY